VEKELSGLSVNLDGCIQKLRREVGAVWPDDSVAIRTYDERHEIFFIAEWLKDFTIKFVRQVYFAFSSISEPDPDNVVF